MTMEDGGPTIQLPAAGSPPHPFLLPNCDSVYALDSRVNANANCTFTPIHAARVAHSTAAVEGARPDRWDIIGAGVALAGAGIIVFGIRSQKTCEP